MRDDRLQPLRQLGPLHGQHRIGDREVEEPACPQHPQHLAECDIVPHAEDALSGIERRQRSRAPAGGGSAGSEADIVVVDRAARARDVDRDEGQEHADDNARGGRHEQQLTGQVRQAASHAAAFRRGRHGQCEPPGVALVPGERDEEQRSEQQQRSRQRPSSRVRRLRFSDRPVGERGERTLAEDAAEEGAGVARRAEREQADRRARALDRAQDPGGIRDVVGGGLEVADEQDRAVLDVVALEHVLRELERRRDPRAGPERVRPRADDLARAGRSEQPDDRAQLTRRRSRRQQLVRHVREDDDADGRIRVDE